MKRDNYKITQTIFRTNDNQFMLYLAKKGGFYLIKLKYNKYDYVYKKYKKINHVKKCLDNLIKELKEIVSKNYTISNYNIILL